MSWSHGTLTGYGKCNGGGRNACADCRAANTQRSSDLRRRRAYGRQSPTDLLCPDLAVNAVRELVGMNYTLSDVVRLSGIAHMQVSRLYRAQMHYITRETHDRVLAAVAYVQAHPGAGRRITLVPSRQAWQQLRSLTALGWPMEHLCEELGYQRSFPPFERAFITVANAGRVQELYDRLSGTRGPSDRAAAHARRLGWHTPLAYDDDGRLIPEAIPSALTEARDRRERQQERDAEVERLTEAQLTARDIAEQLGVTPRTVTRIRARRAS